MLGASTRSSSCAFDQETIETAACGSKFENHGREVRQLNQSATPKRGIDLQWFRLAMDFFNQKNENI